MDDTYNVILSESMDDTYSVILSEAKNLIQEEIMKNRKAAIILTLIMTMSLLGSACSGQSAGSGSSRTAETEASEEAAPVDESPEEVSPKEESSTEEAATEASEDTKEVEDTASSEDSDIIIPVVEHHVIDRSDEKGVYYYSRYDTVSLGDRASDYPELEKVLSEHSAAEEANAEGQADSLGEEDLAFREEMEIDQPFYSNNTFYMKRGDQNIFSYMESSDSFTGGAHGMYGLTGDNYYTADGSMVELSDVIKDTDKLKKVLAEKLTAEYGADTFFDDPETALQPYGEGEGDARFNWVIENEGITFIFNPYEIAPYAAGQQIVTIRFDEEPDIFTGKITAVTGAYVQALGFYQNVSVFDKDGNKHILNVNNDFDYDTPGEYSEYPVISAIIDYDGNTLEDKDIRAANAYEISMYLVHGAGKENYLCIKSGKDRENTSLYELGDDGSVKKSEEAGEDIRSIVDAI